MTDYHHIQLSTDIERDDNTNEYLVIAASDRIIDHYHRGQHIRFRLDLDTIDLSRYKSGRAPLLWDHNHDIPRLGVITDAWVESGKLFTRIRLSDTDAGKALDQDLSSGILSEFSIGFGFDPNDVDESPEDYYIIRNAAPYELSVVNVAPANPDATLVVKLHEVFETMTDKSKTENIDLNKEIAKERARIAEITELAAKYDVDPTEAINSGMSVADYGLHLAKTYTPAKETESKPEAPVVILDRKTDNEDAATQRFDLSAFLREVVTGESGEASELALHYGGGVGYRLTNEMLLATVTGSPSIQGKTVANPNYPLSSDSVLAQAGFTIHNTAEQVSVPVPNGVSTARGVAEGGSYTAGANQIGGETLNATKAAVASVTLSDRLVMSGSAVELFRTQILLGLDNELNAWVFDNLDAQVTPPTAAQVTEQDLIDATIVKQDNFVWVIGLGAARKMTALQLESGSGLRAYDIQTGMLYGRRCIVTDAVGDLDMYAFHRPASLHVQLAGGVMIQIKDKTGALGKELVGSIYFDSRLARTDELTHLIDV